MYVCAVDIIIGYGESLSPSFNPSPSLSLSPRLSPSLSLSLSPSLSPGTCSPARQYRTSCPLPSETLSTLLYKCCSVVAEKDCLVFLSFNISKAASNFNVKSAGLLAFHYCRLGFLLAQIHQEVLSRYTRRYCPDTPGGIADLASCLPRYTRRNFPDTPGGTAQIHQEVLPRYTRRYCPDTPGGIAQKHQEVLPRYTRSDCPDTPGGIAQIHQVVLPRYTRRYCPDTPGGTAQIHQE